MNFGNDETKNKSIERYKEKISWADLGGNSTKFIELLSLVMEGAVKQNLKRIETIKIHSTGY